MAFQSLEVNDPSFSRHPHDRFCRGPGQVVATVAGAAIPNPERAMTAGIPIMMHGCTKDG
jgi:hypothetical protein